MKYLGVEPISPPNFVSHDRSPTDDDYATFNVGDFWLKESDPVADDYEVWILVKKLAKVATWIQFIGNLNPLLSVPCDTGTASPNVAGALSMVGGGFLSTSGATNVVSLAFPDGTAGQLVLGGGGAGAAWSTLTSALGTITITPGVNTLNIDLATGVPATDRFDTDAGLATQAAGIINMLGGTNVGTTGAGNTVTINLDNDVSLTGFLDAATYVEGDNLRMSGNTFSSQNTDGDIDFIPDGAGSVVINNGAADTFIMNDDGQRLMPLQPLAIWNKVFGPAGVTGDGTTVTIIADNVVYDQGGHWDGTSTFTAPIAGKYAANVNLYMYGIVAANLNFMCRTQVITTGQTYESYFNPFLATADPIETEVAYSVGFYLVELGVGDTIQFTVMVTGNPGKNVVKGSNTIHVYLVC